MSDIMKKDGFSYSFDATKCLTCKGNCCIGESGYIWINQNEAFEISKFLNLSFDLFCEKFTYKVKYKMSLKEKKYYSGYACVFFDFEKRQCSIYDVRPSQCRSFPFWDYYKNNVSEVIEECPAIII